jgi:carboxypeptidase T
MARRALTSALALCVLLSLSVSPAAAAGFPAGYDDYHTYDEMVARIDAAVAAYPDIVRKFSIGRSHEGRQIWAVKISDNVHVDEDEPEIVSDGLLHARERLTSEMNLYLIRILTEGYASNSRIRQIVNTREIFIIPMLNPDGGEYDISGSEFRRWRKNRQPNAGTSAIGTDLNRNFGFKWACCGGSSGNPSSDNYRGANAWSAPEVRAYHDFVDSRVVGGRQQIRAALTWHTAGEYVLWPYAYTTKSLPKTMSADDRQALMSLAKGMASRNGYRAQQSGAWYISDGDQIDWLYGEHRIFAFTVEMYPRSGGSMRWYPSPSLIGPETKRNRDAVLWLLEQADCGYRAAGLGATHCGPLNDDFETARGWKVNPNGTDTATSGRWERAVPQQTKTSAGVKQRANVTSGRMALVTGAKAGSGPQKNDVDGGITSVQSPAVKLAAGQPWTLSFRYTFAHNAKSSSADFLRVRVVGNTTSTVFSVAGASSERNASWLTARVSLNAFAGQTVRLLIQAADGASDSLVEAAVDDVRVYRTP